MPVEIVALVALALGKAAGPLLQKAAEKHVESFFGDALKKLAGLGHKKPTVDAMEHAWASVIELVLDNVRVLGDYDPEALEDDEGFQAYGQALARLLGDHAVGAELLKPLLEIDPDAPDVAVLADAWERAGGPQMPPHFSWKVVADAYRKRLAKRRLLTPELHDQLNAENLARVRELLEAGAGVQPHGDEARYARRMREKYRVLDLSAMRPTTSDEEGDVLLRDAFMSQKVREDPPPAELPRDVLRRLVEEGAQPGDKDGDEEDAWRLERLRESYAQRLPEPVLTALGAPANGHSVVLGGPGSGKSTLTRYLLLTAFDPPRDPESGEPMAWTAAFKGHLPLLVELRDFIAEFDEKRVVNFLEYFHYLGRTQKYHLDQGWLDRRLRAEPSLVLFDGLDEIFEARQRERVMHAIAGFAGDYPKARVVVTSRPVGYRDAILRQAGFRHFAIEDLDDEQVEAFVRGWFRRTLPGREKEAEERRERVLRATRAPAIRLLAGNPMLLTIMAMIAQLRELPRERWRFYDHAADVLCHHWDVNRHLVDAGFADYVGLEDKKELLRRIAVSMQEGEGGLAGNVIRESVLRAEVEGYLKSRYGTAGGEAKKLATEVIRQLRERNYVLCLRGPQLYGFVHRTFLEYFCAVEIVRKLREVPEYTIERLRDEVFAAHWREAEWREVLRLICGMVGEQNVGVLMDFLTHSAYPDWRARIEEEPPANLVLAVQCLAEVRNPRALENEALAMVQAIVETMAYWGSRFGGHSYYQLISEELISLHPDHRLPEYSRRWLEQEWPSIARRLTSVLMQLSFSQLASMWLSESPFSLLRERALQDENEYVRSAALEALARGWSQEASTLELLRDRALQDENYNVRGAALSALARGWSQEPSTLELLRERALQDENEDVRIAALEALARGWSQEASTLELLRERALQDENEDVRGAAVTALVRDRVDRRVLLLLSRDLDGAYPFRHPISIDHLRKSAERLHIDEATARDLLASCESVLGWNPLEGGRSKLEAGGKGKAKERSSKSEAVDGLS